MLVGWHTGASVSGASCLCPLCACVQAGAFMGECLWDVPHRHTLIPCKHAEGNSACPWPPQCIMHVPCMHAWYATNAPYHPPLHPPHLHAHTTARLVYTLRFIDIDDVADTGIVALGPWPYSTLEGFGGVYKHRIVLCIDAASTGATCLCRGELGDCLGALGHGMLGQLAW